MCLSVACLPQPPASLAALTECSLIFSRLLERKEHAFSVQKIAKQVIEQEYHDVHGLSTFVQNSRTMIQGGPTIKRATSG
jgi:hypothetical protein